MLREVGGDAYLWAKKDIADVTKQLTKLITDEKLAKKLATAGPKQANKYSWGKSVKNLVTRLGE